MNLKTHYTLFFLLFFNWRKCCCSSSSIAVKTNGRKCTSGADCDVFCCEASNSCDFGVGWKMPCSCWFPFIFLGQRGHCEENNCGEIWDLCWSSMHNNWLCPCGKGLLFKTGTYIHDTYAPWHFSLLLICFFVCHTHTCI